MESPLARHQRATGVVEVYAVVAQRGSSTGARAIATRLLAAATGSANLVRTLAYVPIGRMDGHCVLAEQVFNGKVKGRNR